MANHFCSSKGLKSIVQLGLSLDIHVTLKSGIAWLFQR